MQNDQTIQYLKFKLQFFREERDAQCLLLCFGYYCFRILLDVFLFHDLTLT